MSQCDYYKKESDGSIRFCVLDIAEHIRGEHEDYLGFRYGRWLCGGDIRRVNVKGLANLASGLRDAGALCAAERKYLPVVLSLSSRVEMRGELIASLRAALVAATRDLWRIDCGRQKFSTGGLVITTCRDHLGYTDGNIEDFLGALYHATAATPEVDTSTGAARVDGFRPVGQVEHVSSTPTMPAERSALSSEVERLRAALLHIIEVELPGERSVEIARAALAVDGGGEGP